MCTIVFQSLSEGFVLGHNRDESLLRPPALPPTRHRHKNIEYLMPIDPVSEGTWIWTNDEATSFLFNGGFEKHKRNPPYARSRGRILRESIEYPDVYQFIQKVDLSNVEPFTFVYIDHLKNYRMNQMIWDGRKKYTYTFMNPKQRVWCSSTLYDRNVRMAKADLYERLRAGSEKMDMSQVMKSKEKVGNTSMILDKGDIQTVSTTVVEYDGHTSRMKYHTYRPEDSSFK